MSWGPTRRYFLAGSLQLVMFFSWALYVFTFPSNNSDFPEELCCLHANTFLRFCTDITQFYFVFIVSGVALRCYVIVILAFFRSGE